jgi:hypothetical protein
VVWQHDKPRFVVDMRKVNNKLLLNSYPLPRQDDVLETLAGCTIFSAMDIRKGFFQQPILESDRWKTTFVTAHRGLERLKVSTMGLATTPSFFQQRMENILRPYLWKTVIVYVDDIIVFSRSQDEHLQHLTEVLDLLEQSGVTLQISKCHFGYESIKALGHHVSRLGLATDEEKIEAIKKLEYPRTLSELETGLGLFGYYRKFCLGFSYIAEPLEQLKTALLKGAPYKKPKRKTFAHKTSADFDKDCRDAWDSLKETLADAPIRALPKFDKPFLLYTDGSKEFGFGAALHQVDDDGKERPILFLSKKLSSAERNYWPTELEVAAAVWAIGKLRQYLDGNQFTLFTDHSALKGLIQSAAPQRKNPRLVRWALFMSQFGDYLKIVHRPGRVHRNADALSRLQQSRQATPKPSTSPVRPADDIPTSFLVNVLSMEPGLRKSIVSALPADRHLGRIYKNLQEIAQSGDPGNPTKNGFKLDMASGLLYIVRDSCERLCIPSKAHKLVLMAAHDHKGHPGIQRTQDRLRRTVYIPRLKALVESYVLACPICKASKEERHLPYGQLHPITTPSQPFSVITIDFIVSLPKSPKGYDALMVIVDKFTKAVKLLPGKTTYTAIDWARKYFKRVYPSWGLPQVIISDRDSKFTSEFWTYLFTRAQVRLGITAAYHPAADGQTERFNAVIETMFRCMLCQLPDETIWERLVPDVEHLLMTSVSDSTKKTPFELLYGVPARSEFMPAPPTRMGTADEFINDRERIRAEAADALQYAQGRMAFYFDRKHKPVELKKYAYIRLTRKPGHVGYSLEGSSCLSPVKMGPFRIIRRVGNLAYELDLPQDLHIHPVVSVVHLEQAPDDPWHRQTATTIPDEVHKLSLPFEVEAIREKRLLPIRKGSKRRIWHYLVKWRDIVEPSWQPMTIIAAQAPLLVAAYEGNLQTDPATTDKSTSDNIPSTSDNIQLADANDPSSATVAATGAPTVAQNSVPTTVDDNLLDTLNTTEEVSHNLHQEAQRALRIIEH